MSALCDSLRTAEVQVDGIAPIRDVLSGVEEVFPVVGAELDDEGPVVRRDALDRLGGEVKHLVAVFRLCRKRGGVEHGGVAEVGAVCP